MQKFVFQKARKYITTTLIMAMLISPVGVYSVITEPPMPTAPLPGEHWNDGYAPNDGVIEVHTPVISPVSIRDANGGAIPNNGKGYTQLVTENGSAWYQLRLDNDYILHWDAWVHREIMGYGDSGEDPSKYDKYTQDKWMKFPFEVFYDGVFYELRADRYTDWIRIKRPANWEEVAGNHWINTPIYIPSYAREMGEAGNTGSIFYKVEAINVDGEYGGWHGEEQELNANTTYTFELADDGASYVATYEIPIQLSGYIYDFTVTGTNNGAVYAGENDVTTNEYSFVMSKTEKKAGTTNRIGEPAIRYLLDGALAPTPWSTKNTITLTDAKSAQFTKQGAVWKGQTFSFCIKTIANLWDQDNGDRLEIKPTFTFYDANGNKRDMSQIKVYYHNPYGSGKYIEYGSSRDTASSNISTTYIGQKMNEGAYYTKNMSDGDNGGPARRYHFGNWSGFTASKYGISEEVLLNRKVNSYCLSHITLNPELRLYSGEWEQLHWNIEGSGKEYEGVVKYDDISLTGLNEADITRFRESIQTWYGSYYAPSDLFVVDLTKHPGFNIDDYLEHAHGGLGVPDDDEIFEKGGYLIVNFDIVSYNDGHVHLRYLGGSSGAGSDGNMWDEESFPNTPDPDDPNSPPIPEYDDGDVIVIDLSKAVKDRYRAGIYDIN